MLGPSSLGSGCRSRCVPLTASLLVLGVWSPPSGTDCRRPRLPRVARDFHECEGDVDHALETRDRDPLVGRVDVGHPVGEVQTAETALVEYVRIGGAAGEAVARLVIGALERGGGEPDHVVTAAEAVAAIALARTSVDGAFPFGGGERKRLLHLLE